MSFEKLHITDLHEFLAGAVLRYKKPLEVAIREIGDDGFIKIALKESDECFDTDPIDFELMGCECSGLGEEFIFNDYLGKTVSTSSAYEFVDFAGNETGSFSMLINIEEGMWKIKLLKAEY